MADCVSVDRNGVAQEVWWKQGPDVSAFSGVPVRLRFKMRSAKLYAFQFCTARRETELQESGEMSTKDEGNEPQRRVA